MVKKFFLSIIALFALYSPVFSNNIEEYKCDLLIKGYEFTNDGLSEAIIKNDKEAVELFIKTDLNINLPDTDGYSALDRAIKSKNKETVTLIANAGGETKKVSQYELNEIENNNQNELPSNSSLNKLCQLVNSNNYEAVENLIKTSDEINLLSKEGLAPLHYAIFNNNINMVKILLKYGADSNILTDDGITPLDIAVLNFQKEIAQVLINYYAELSENVAKDLEKFGCKIIYDEELNLYQADFENIFTAMEKIQQKISE